MTEAESRTVIPDSITLTTLLQKKALSSVQIQEDSTSSQTSLQNKKIASTIPKQKKALSSAQIQEANTVSRMSLLNKSAPLVKENELRYKSHVKETVEVNSYKTY